MDGPSKIGQVHLYSGKVAVPPPVTLTVIDPPVGWHVEAAHSAKCPSQIVKS
jgi:hypothetical protein